KDRAAGSPRDPEPGDGRSLRGARFPARHAGRAHAPARGPGAGDPDGPDDLPAGLREPREGHAPPRRARSRSTGRVGEGRVRCRESARPLARRQPHRGGAARHAGVVPPCDRRAGAQRPADHDGCPRLARSAQGLARELERDAGLPSQPTRPERAAGGRSLEHAQRARGRGTERSRPRGLSRAQSERDHQGTLTSMPRARPSVLIASLLLAFAAGCVLRGDGSQFYMLSASASAPLTGHPVRVGLGPVNVPAYLDAPTIVTRVDPNRLEYARFDRWASPLSLQVARVLAADLGAAGAITGVSYPPYPSPQGDAVGRGHPLSLERASRRTGPPRPPRVV